MNAENSLTLQDFAYQLEHFVFKVKSKSLEARFRAWIHDILRKTSLRDCFDGLKMPLRSQYSLVEHAIATEYLLQRYCDFIDRRRGSIPMPGDSYSSAGVLLDSVTRMALEFTEEDHVEALKHLERTRQQLEAARRSIDRLSAWRLGVVRWGCPPRVLLGAILVSSRPTRFDTA